MPDTPRSVRLVIADDHPIFRDGLRRLLESEPGFVVVGEAGNGAEAVERVRKLQPDILLLDVAMPVVTGLDALEQLAHLSTSVRTILLTASVDKDQIVTALQLGARGVVLKDTATSLLFKSINCVMDGQFWVGRHEVADLIATLREMMATGKDQERKKHFGLTPRELDVIGAIVGGSSNKEIAKTFTISEDTVKHHLTNAFNKVGVSNRLELALFAVHHRLVKDI
jgi:two-component system, NarL family, nitrate/nitrite response regulator NarL